MKPSIIYLTYRPGGYDILVDSLKNQTYQDYELIIIDDFTEERRKLAKEYLEENNIEPAYIGPSKPKCFPELPYNLINAYNTGILLSTEDLIIILNDYIWLPPKSIERFLKYEEKYKKKFCITAVAKVWKDARPKNLNGLLSVWENEWKGEPEKNGCTFKFNWIPTKFELFYSAIPYDLLIDMNGFPECYDYQPAYQEKIFMEIAEQYGAKFYVDKENIVHHIDHHEWGGILWHIGSGETSLKLVERPNCFDLKNYKRGKI